MKNKNLQKSQLLQSPLETANAMFKNAFLVKKTRFAHENPGLSDEALNKMTADYFRNLPSDKTSGKL